MIAVLCRWSIFPLIQPYLPVVVASFLLPKAGYWAASHVAEIAPVLHKLCTPLMSLDFRFTRFRMSRASVPPPVDFIPPEEVIPPPPPSRRGFFR